MRDADSHPQRDSQVCLARSKGAVIQGGYFPRQIFEKRPHDTRIATRKLNSPSNARVSFTARRTEKEFLARLRPGEIYVLENLVQSDVGEVSHGSSARGMQKAERTQRVDAPVSKRWNRTKLKQTTSGRRRRMAAARVSGF